MIAKVAQAIAAATGPDRALDVDIHEVLTGELNQCKSGVLETSRANGQILREPGGELKWFNVPQYTSDCDIAIIFLHKQGKCIQITTNSDEVIKAVTDYIVKRYMASAWLAEKMEQVGYNGHSSSLALCLIGLVLAVAMRPKGAKVCCGCHKDFVPAKEFLEQAAAHDCEVLFVCPECCKDEKYDSLAGR